MIVLCMRRFLGKKWMRIYPYYAHLCPRAHLGQAALKDQLYRVSRR